jgi:FAD/FMN-containing dehydrogenase
VLTASAEEHPDLFWGIRGGGAHFGVATSFEFDCFEIWHLGGAVSDVTPDATAYAHRDTAFVIGISATWRDPAADEAHLSWAEASWRDLRESQATLEGFYPGFPGFVTGEERVRIAYGDNLDRLADLKAEYDPENLLASNLNVVSAR